MLQMSLTYLHGSNPPPQSVPGLQEFEVFEAILGEVTRSRETGDASSDDYELVVVVQLLLLLPSLHQPGDILSVVSAEEEPDCCWEVAR